MKTGRFSEQHRIFFDANDGAYTFMTDAEIKKRTFNVKVVIRDMVIGHMGEDVIPQFGAPDNTVTFNGCDKTSEFAEKTFQLTFKFSKPPPKKEMSIYLSRSAGIPDNKLNAGNIWFVYFRKDSVRPWIGIMSPTEWASVVGIDYYCDDFEIEDKKRKVSYSFDINTIVINEVAPPEKAKKLIVPAKKRKEILCGELQNQLENRKTIGTKGEEVVLEFEKRKLCNAGRADLAEKVKWKSAEVDGLGYDIESFNLLPNGKEETIFIEVKATMAGVKTPFNISLNEVEASQRYGKAYYIYRVFNLSEDGSAIKLYKTNGPVENHFELEAVAFKATKK